MRIAYKPGYCQALDGLRGMAIILVLLFHCFQFLPGPFHYLAEIGWVGVDLFFVLSGFLITGILLDVQNRAHFFRNFYAKRVLRIFPLYYLVLVVFYLLIQVPGIHRVNPMMDPRHLEGMPYFLTFTQNIYFAYTGWGVTDILNHFWSLAIEEQFYMLWPLIVYYGGSKGIMRAGFIAILVSLITRNTHVDSDYSYVFTLARIDALVIGAMLAVLIRTRSAMLDFYLPWVFWVTASILIFILTYSGDFSFRNPYLVRFGYTLFALLFASIIGFIYSQEWKGQLLNRAMSVRFLIFFGKYAYGLYVYHWLLYIGVYKVLEVRYQLSSIFIVPFLAVVILISMLSYQYFERFFLRYKRFFNEETGV